MCAQDRILQRDEIAVLRSQNVGLSPWKRSLETAFATGVRVENGQRHEQLIIRRYRRGRSVRASVMRVDVPLSLTSVLWREHFVCLFSGKDSITLAR